MVNIISNDVIKEIRAMTCSDNVLFNYDNYTYNIELCMIPKDVMMSDYSLKKLDYIHNKNNNTSNNMIDFILNNAKKMTIVNTTTTSEMYIDKMTISTVIGPDNNGNPSSFSQNYTMKIVETMGCSLSNKLKIAASYYGYSEGYALMPMFLIVYFSGYDGNTLEGISGLDVIDNTSDVSRKYFMQEVVITNISVNIGSTGTTYEVKLSASSGISLNADLFNIHSTEIDFYGNDKKNYMNYAAKELVNRKKDYIKQTFANDADYNKIYADDGPLEIEFVDYDDGMPSLVHTEIINSDTESIDMNDDTDNNSIEIKSFNTQTQNAYKIPTDNISYINADATSMSIKQTSILYKEASKSMIRQSQLMKTDDINNINNINVVYDGFNSKTDRDNNTVVFTQPFIEKKKNEKIKLECIYNKNTQTVSQWNIDYDKTRYSIEERKEIDAQMYTYKNKLVNNILMTFTNK